MSIQRSNSIYGSYPYNKLGSLPNADNLMLSIGSKSPLSVLEDEIDFPGNLRSGGGSGGGGTTGVGISHIDRLFSVVKDNTNSMVNLIIVVTVLVIENLVKGRLFTCPCEKPQNKLYGAAFLGAPAAALFVVGVMANNKTWLLVTGRCHRQPTDYQQAHLSHWYHALGVITKAFVAPLAWVIIGFIDGQFYQCAASEDPCGGSDKVFLMSKSQMIGYVILMVSMSTAIFGMLLWRASRPMSYEQDNYINIYRTIERMEIHRQFEAHAQAVAHQNVKEFLAKESRPKKDWDYIAHVPSITPTTGPRGMDGAPPSMSPLNKLVQKERRESMESNGVLAPRLGLVGIDNHALHTQCSGEDVPLGELKIEHGSGSVA